MKALTAAEMREVDRLTTERYGIPSLQLMEAAGKHVADAVRQKCFGLRPRRVAILCGKGNNGGDGLVAARLLKEAGLDPFVYLFAKREELRGDAGANLERWLNLANEIAEITDASDWERVWPKVEKSHVIVDSMLGTGLRGAATGLIAQAIEKLNQHSGNATRACPALILSVDTPSGLPSDGQASEGPVLRAHLTITFTAPKVGQLVSSDAACTGQLLVRPIGSPESLIEEIGHGTLRWSGPDEFADVPLVRPADSHKGSFGHILLVAGSLGKSGAAILAGQAALRAGAGLVTVATPDVIQPVVASGQPEYMTEPLASTTAGTVALANLSVDHLSTQLEGKTVLAIGPGLGTYPETQQFIRHLVQHSSLPVILDADGLNAFVPCPDALHQRNSQFLCITPHPGEMARLLGTSSASVQQDRVRTAVDAARRWNAYVVLKGFHTVLASPSGKVFVNTSGNAGLAKGGSGDVLAGLLAALTAQFGTEDWLRVLALGVYLHGSAADMPGRAPDLSGILAQEIAKNLPSARASLIRELQRRA
jgi:ADP-dependent NAD(P)H-hydrate dehydratase / NAD(P)H-hydrate epimerase